jgi:hypothetical protein
MGDAMGDEGDTSGARRNNQSILLGIAGAVLGYAAGVAIAPFDRMDGITSAFIALFVIGPIGAIAGAFLGARLRMLGRTRPPGAETAVATPQAGATGNAVADAPARNALKALGIVAAIVTVLGGGYAFYAYMTATPWLRPGNQRLQFEVRLPAGTPMPRPDSVKAMLLTTVNTMPADMTPAAFRQDGDRAVIAGYIWLAYRSNSRQIEVTIPGRQNQTYPIKIASSPQHMKQLGAWEKHPDGSEIRYRVQWPGED